MTTLGEKLKKSPQPGASRQLIRQAATLARLGAERTVTDKSNISLCATGTRPARPPNSARSPADRLPYDSSALTAVFFLYTLAKFAAVKGIFSAMDEQQIYAQLENIPGRL